MARPPKVDSDGARELNKIEEQIDTLTEKIEDPSLNMRAHLPHVETAEQTRLTQKQLKKDEAPYIKPLRGINSKERFNPKYEEAHKKAWEYVKVIVENKEIIGEEVQVWTKRFAGDPAHFWKVPVNKPIHIPRLLAEQLSQCSYNRLKMQPDEREITTADGVGTYIGALQFEEKIDRITCKPVGFNF